MYSGNPLGIYLTPHTESTQGRSVSSLLGQISNILFRFFFSPPSQVCTWVSGLCEQLSLLSQECWGGAKLCPVPGLAQGPGRRGLVGEHTLGILACWMLFNTGAPLTSLKQFSIAQFNFLQKDIICLPVYSLKTFQSTPLQSQTSTTLFSKGCST